MATRESVEGISTATKVIITIAFVSVALAIYNVVMPMLQKGVKDTSVISQRIINGNYSQYNGAVKQGSEVIGAINTQAADDFYVKVKTNSNASGKKYTTTTYNITDKNDVNYIEPTEKFDSVLDINDNGAIIGIIFTQN